MPEFESAWLYKIAHNVCLSRALGASRRSRVESPHDLQLLEERVAAPAQNGHDDLLGLDDALARMPENLRRAILLREWQGLSYAEIAEALGVSQSAVETLIFRARRHLAHALENGVKRPVRKAAQALNIGPLLGALRALLGGAGAVKVAAGLAVVGAGLAGGGFVMSGSLSSSGTPARARPAQATATPAVAGGRHASPNASPARPAGAAAVHGTKRSRIRGHAQSPGSLQAAALPGTPAVETGAGPFAPATPLAPGAQQPQEQPGASQQDTSPPGARSAQPQPQPAPSLLPTAQTPSVATPTGSTPAVPAPTVPTPSVSVPTVTTPSVSVPTVTTPSVSVPTVTTPSVSVPTVTTPSVSVPTATTPSVGTSDLGLPLPEPTLPATGTVP